MFSISFLIGQILTLISYLVFWISRFIKRKNNILFLDNVSRILAILAFAFLGTYDGIKYTVYAIARNTLGQITNNKSKKNKFTIFMIMLILLILMYSFNFNGVSTICIVVCGILNLYGVVMCKEQGIRIFGMLGSAFYMAFMFVTGNIIGTICEIICFFVMLASYLKYRKKEYYTSKNPQLN